MPLDPYGLVSIPPRQLRGQSWGIAVRVATTGNITIATALNAGDTIDGVTLAAGDDVLVKDQSTGSQNGIYVAGATPKRRYDMDQDQTTGRENEEIAGHVVRVVEGTVNGGTWWQTTNPFGDTLGSDDVVWEQVTFAVDTSDFELNIEGGQSVISAHGNTGTTETFDPTAGNIHTATLNADCTFTLAAPVGSGAATLELYITASGTRTWTWPGSVVWPGGVTPDPPADTLLKRLILETLDGGTTWYGVEVGGGSSSLTIKEEGTPLATAATSIDFVGAGITASGAAAAKTVTLAVSLDNLTDATITAPAEGDILRYSGSVWVNYSGHYEPVVDDFGSGPEIVFDDGDIVMEWFA